MERPKFEDYTEPKMSQLPRSQGKLLKQYDALVKFAEAQQEYINHLESQRVGDSIGLSSDVSNSFAWHEVEEFGRKSFFQKFSRRNSSHILAIVFL